MLLCEIKLQNHRKYAGFHTWLPAYHCTCGREWPGSACWRRMGMGVRETRPIKKQESRNPEQVRGMRMIGADSLEKHETI